MKFMPIRLPNAPQIEIAAGAKLVVFHFPKKDGFTNPAWYLTYYDEKRRGNANVSLREPYNPDEDIDPALIEKATEILAQRLARLAKDLPASEKTFMQTAEDFLESAKTSYKKNKALIDRGREPTLQIIDGRGVWDYNNFVATRGHIEKYIRPYWEKNKKKVTQVRQKDVDNWSEWRQQNFPEIAPGTVHKINITMRHIFKYAQRMGEEFIIPKVRGPKKQISKRRRPEIDSDQISMVFDSLKESYFQLREKAETVPGVEWRANYRFLLWMYCETLLYTGARPWQTRANAVRMKDITRKYNPLVLMITRKAKREESYTIAADRLWIKTIDRLNRFYENYGIGEDREYLFVHPITIGTRRKGEPILSFKKQWHVLMRELGINDYKDEGEKYERVNFYSFRHAYVGRQLRYNRNLTPAMLAKQLATSMDMIERVYNHFVVEREYETIVGDSLDYVETVDIFDEKGRLQETVPTNSERHWEAWKQYPGLVAYEPR
jgi:hypothetical protein